MLNETLDVRHGHGVSQTEDVCTSVNNRAQDRSAVRIAHALINILDPNEASRIKATDEDALRRPCLLANASSH